MAAQDFASQHRMEIAERRDARLARHVLRVTGQVSSQEIALRHIGRAQLSHHGLDLERSQHATDLNGLPA